MVKQLNNMEEYTLCEVEGCFNCPFMYQNIDDYAVGNDTLVACSLAENSNSIEYVIETYKRDDEDKEINTPSWCPLKNKPLLLKFKK